MMIFIFIHIRQVVTDSPLLNATPTFCYEFVTN